MFAHLQIHSIFAPAKTGISSWISKSQNDFKLYRARSSVGSEHLVYTQGVRGSNPFAPTTTIPSHREGIFFALRDSNSQRTPWPLTNGVPLGHPITRSVLFAPTTTIPSHREGIFFALRDSNSQRTAWPLTNGVPWGTPLNVRSSSRPQRQSLLIEKGFFLRFGSGNLLKK